MKEKLKCLSVKTADLLYSSIHENLDRYKTGDFTDLANTYGWSVELQLQVDLKTLADLDGNAGAEQEIKNSLLVWHAMEGLTPSLACENRIWTRLTHLEGFAFSRQRWLKQESDEAVAKSVSDHFFANSRTKWRDDNALSRLWWIAYIASLIPAVEHKTALQFILCKADIRSNFVERPWITTRPKLAAGILRGMMRDEWTTAREENYRRLMKQVNKYGGGVYFESWRDSELDNFISSCISLARTGS